MRRLLSIALMLFAGSVLAFQPRTGHWWDPAEPGRGFNIDIQDGVMVLTVYTYDVAGNAQWYLASGNMTNGQGNFTGTLDRYVNGQCVVCNFRPAQLEGNDGLVSVAFTSEVSAVVTLPGNHVSYIEPFNFKVGNPPEGLLGEWVFVEDIGGVTFADRYDLTTLLAPSATGNGGAYDPVRFAECELQVRGPDAGWVYCVDATPGGAVENAFIFIFGLDETFEGSYIAASGTEYPMKGFKVISRTGFTKAAARDAAGPLKATAIANAPAKKASPERMRALQSLAQRLAEQQER